jgi:hypothetical protein
MNKVAAKTWMIEVRDRNGFWSHKTLATSTSATGFRMGSPRYETLESAEQALRELVAVGWRAEQLRVVPCVVAIGGAS